MFSLKSLAEALQGGPEEEEEDELEEGQEGELEGQEGGDDDELEDEDEEEGSGAAAPLASLWGVASALTATVKARTAQVLTAVQEVDWREELEAFQQGAKEDAEAVGKGADAVLHKAREAAEQLPTTLEHLPENAATLQSRAGGAAAAARVRAERSLANLAGLGSKLVLGTHDLFEQISSAVQNEMAMIDDGAVSRRSSSRSLAGQQGRYSRFEADVAAMQRDSSTYCDEPEDTEEYRAWLAGFDLASRKPDIERLIAENTFMSELQARIVPLIVEYEAFWTRYFYRLHCLEQKHEQFRRLAQRAADPGEEVGWSDEEEAQPAAQPAPPAAAPAAAAAGSGGAASAAGTLAAAALQQPLAHQAGADAPLGESAEAEDAAGEVAALHAVDEEDAAADLPVTSPGSPAGAAAQRGASSQLSAAVSAHSHTGSTDGSAAAASSDSDHWQVVRSPRQEPAPAAAASSGAATSPVGGQRQSADGPAAPQQTAAQVAKTAVEPAEAEEAGAASAIVAQSTEAAAAAADDTESETRGAVAGPAADAGDEASAGDGDGDLSDWGDDDEAALAAAAASAGQAGGASGAAEDWGSDWE